MLFPFVDVYGPNICKKIFMGSIGILMLFRRKKNSLMTNLLSIKSKIYTLSELIEAIKIWRNKGDKIVFTNGCFDLVQRTC